MVSHYANDDERGRLITGFRALADYLESNPYVPAPRYSDVFVFPTHGDCAGMRAEIGSIAERIGVEACETVRGHYVASRSFGPIEYRAVAICQHSQERT